MVRLEIVLAMAMFVLCSCNSKKTKYETDISSLAGREISMPTNLTTQILDYTISFCLEDADYTIVAYIDSAGCTPCKMKLKEWDKFMNQLKANGNIDVAFLMIVNSQADDAIMRILNRDEFLHPISFDPKGDFAKYNNLPKDDEYHTFILDSNNEIVLVGNPVINPKIRELYRNVATSDDGEYIKGVSIPVGAINAGVDVVKQFEVRNWDSVSLSIQDLVPSCECISATINIDTIQPGKSGMLTVKYRANSIPGPVSRYVDVYFNEKEHPERFVVHGYVITN